MKLADNQPKIIDEVITEVRFIKRTIAERHGNDIDRLLGALILQERNAAITAAGQASAEQAETCSESKSESCDEPQPEAERRAQ